MVLVMPADLRAARAWKKSLELTCKQLSSISSETDSQSKREGRDGRKGLGLESGLAEALRQSLNKAWEEERNTGRGESKRAAEA